MIEGLEGVKEYSIISDVWQFVNFTYSAPFTLDSLSLQQRVYTMNLCTAWD